MDLCCSRQPNAELWISHGVVQLHWEGEPGTRVLGKDSELIRAD